MRRAGLTALAELLVNFTEHVLSCIGAEHYPVAGPSQSSSPPSPATAATAATLRPGKKLNFVHAT